jgi:predicted nucleic acid-binding protein
MTSVVVDTDVVSFLFKNDSRAQLYLPLLKNRKLLVSFMTEAELEQWILLARWGESRVQRFQEFMTGFVSCLHPAT